MSKLIQKLIVISQQFRTKSLSGPSARAIQKRNAKHFGIEVVEMSPVNCWTISQIDSASFAYLN